MTTTGTDAHVEELVFGKNGHELGTRERIDLLGRCEPVAGLTRFRERLEDAEIWENHNGSRRFVHVFTHTNHVSGEETVLVVEAGRHRATRLSESPVPDPVPVRRKTHETYSPLVDTTIGCTEADLRDGEVRHASKDGRHLLVTRYSEEDEGRRKCYIRLPGTGSPEGPGKATDARETTG